MAAADWKIWAEVYRDASAEHASMARELYDSGRFVQAVYLAGLSVECILRAYRLVTDPEFDSRHDIDRLYKLAKFGDVAPHGKSEEIGALLGTVTMLWSNDLRYLSLAAMRRRWSARRLYQGIRGDFVKERTRQLVNAASELVAIGVARWKHSFKN